MLGLSVILAISGSHKRNETQINDLHTHPKDLSLRFIFKIYQLT